MIVNASTLKAIFVNLKVSFNNAFDDAPSQWQKIAMLVPSTARSNDYKWLSTFPRMQKWIGEKAVKALAASSYSITNDDWEATVEVDRNDIEDDNLGIYAPQAQMAGFSAKQLPDEIVFELVNKGFSSFCYDGQYFFDTDHPVQGQSVANKGSKKLSAASLDAAEASLGVAFSAVGRFKDDEGRPLNINPNVLLVPPTLRSVATILATSDKLGGQDPNPFKGKFEVVVDARLVSDTAWFLLDTTKPIKPFIYQQRKAPVFVEQTDPQADSVFMRRKFKFGAEARVAGGYGFWQMAYGSTGTEA